MERRTAITILLLAGRMAPLSGQENSREHWRATLQAADRLSAEGRFGEAERMLRLGLAEARRLEPDPAPAATTYHNLAGLYQDTGRCDSAVWAYQRSLELWQKLGARGEKYLLPTANHLVGAYLGCGDVGEAERHHAMFVAPRIAARRGRDPDPDIAQALTNLGSIQFAKHRYRDSRAAYEEALAMLQRLSDDPSKELAVVLSNLAFALLRTGERDRALVTFRRSVAAVESAAGRSDPLLIATLVNGANLCLAAGRQAEAEPLIERALEASRGTLGEEHPLTVKAMSSYAVLLKETHRKKEAAAVETRVRAIRETLLHSAARQTVDVRELSGVK